MKKNKEVDLAEKVISWLEKNGWDVYQEVLCKTGRRIDIYAVKGHDTWAIETKLNFGLTVIEQAYRNKVFAHYSSVAVPTIRKNLRFRLFGLDICKHYGIGNINVIKTSWRKRGRYKGVIASSFDIKSDIGLRNASPLMVQLHKEQKVFAKVFAKAGNNKGKFWSPFKATVQKIEGYLEKKKKKVSLQKVIRNIDHHYAHDTSAYGALSKLIQKGVLKNVAFKKKGRKILIFRNRS